MQDPARDKVLLVHRRIDGALARPDEVVLLRLGLREDFLEIGVVAPFHGDLLPEAPPGPVEGLWEHEVVELFVASEQAPDRYLEIELGPGGHHLVLQLQGVRRAIARALPLDFTADRHGGSWWGRARVPLDLLPPAPWRVNATAIHGQGGDRRYLSWQPLPGASPDFHQPHRFPALRFS